MDLLWRIFCSDIHGVEIDTLAGDNSRLEALDEKMRYESFPHGVQLGWFNNPKNKEQSDVRIQKRYT
jgi:hypothetical protein